ncbi:MAG: 16S rRNA (guanine(527)-N(7))-methyltransferase RsmG [Agathobacter sp.]|nr:16S rRNA (guanine(527)-N(7))-methyltransferase RsmG [Agathobacter sp.]
MKYDLSYFEEQLKKYRITLTEKQKEQFITYYEMLVEKNKVMNLTAITEFDEVLEKHFLDSVSLIQVCDLKQNLSVIDLGTGAGFPGIPLKIIFPELQITLVDSLNKRIGFLKEVIEALELVGIEAVHCRAEEFAHKKEYREAFDLCVSRAVANLSTLSEYCLPFVKVGGNFISYKSGECDEEVAASKKAVSILGGEIKDIYKFTLGDSGRAFVTIQKTKRTPKSYPRKAGTPSKMPIS